MPTPNYKRTKYSCYFAYLAMSSVFSLPPLLFTTFREMYGISYTLLGTLVLINFTTQMTVDLIFTFFTKYFNIKATIRTMPILTALGLTTYALVPLLCPDHAYVGLVIGTVIFSIAAGLCEVLLSPLVAALPSDHPERDMSTLHSLYAYGVLSVVLISTLLLKWLGNHNWMYVTLFWAVLPVLVCVAFCLSPFPDMDLSHAPTEKKSKLPRRTVALALCVGCIFLGSAAENIMTNWISSYVENALHLPKVVADILGLALFAVLLALTRTYYAKKGKNIINFLTMGMAGAVICYLTAGLCPVPLISMLACVLTGIFTAMLWPGTLIMMEENIPHVSVAAYALMAAGGDFGASSAPQLMGVIVDTVAQSRWAADICRTLSLTPDQLGMKVGMLIAAIFPVLGVLLLLYIKRYFKKQKETI